VTRPRRWRWWGKWVAAASTSVVVAVLFASGWGGVSWKWDSVWGTTSFSLGRGWLAAYRVHEFHGEPQWPGTVRTWPSDGGPQWRYWFEWELHRGFAYYAAIPLWAPCAAGLLTAAILWRVDRRRPGLCRHCHYDLSATPPSTPCPECGRAQQGPNAEAAEGAERITS
jgi:hypothetical protein